MPSKYTRKTVARDHRPIYVIGPSIAYIPLTKGISAIVDVEDAERIASRPWFAQWCKNTKSYYANRHVISNGVKAIIAMHRVVTECPRHLVVDHRNHHTTDNRRANLLNTTHSGNKRNPKPK